MSTSNIVKPIFFKSKTELRKWLKKNHASSKEVWIGYYKKDSGQDAISYQDALDEMLCFGWIDGVKNSIDEISYCNRFTPRTNKSKWSKINREKVERLIEEGLMTSAGLKAVEEAKADGRWGRAYDSPKSAEVPEEFMRALKKNKKALAFFKTLSKQNLFSVTYRIQNAKKAETKEKWIKKFIEMFEKGEKIH